jgi:predicted membrane-bound spermidine synthase/tetratricopeptide (TPR) repeat protein
MYTPISWLFFLSGITGLIYEVLWAKYLALLLGNTAQAHTIILATFLGGLALGNAVFGPQADKVTRHLRLYGWLELGIGVLGLLSPTLLHFLSDAYMVLASQQGLSPMLALGLRLALCVGVLLLPAILMGGTLPLLSRFAAPSLHHVEATVSWFYFVNSAGAACGAILAGFFLIPTFGLDFSTSFAACINIGIGVAAFALAARAIPQQQISSVQQTYGGSASAHDARRGVIIYAAVSLSGFVALAYEIAWIRLLALVLGSSTYSFSLMLAAFIAGIACGSYLISRRLCPQVDPYRLFGLAELGVAVSILVTLPLYERLPYLFLRLSGLLNRTPETFYVFEVIKFLLCFALMLVPTSFLGMTLPLASRVVTPAITQMGRKVALVFSLNTLGNVLGAVLVGLWLLPLLGVKGLIESGIIVNLLLAFVVLWTAGRTRQWWRALAMGAGLAGMLLGIVSLPSWDSLSLSSGQFRNRRIGRYHSYDDYRRSLHSQTLLFHKDDRDATVTVVQGQEGELYLKVNGKTDASSRGDLPTQLLLAHVPLLLKPEAQHVLLVGLGSGITAGSALRHPLERLDVVEISAGVVEAAQFFKEHNRHALQDHRLHLHLEDANTFLRLTPRRYDVIISEPSNPWIAGVGNLFSVEFYQAVQHHLREGGVLAQWFHSYEMDDNTLELILRTCAAVFQHVTLWKTLSEDILILGSASPLAVDFSEVSTRFDLTQVREDLQRIEIRRLATLLSLQMATDATVRKIAGRGRFNEDYYPILEYEAPKAFFLGSVASLIRRYDERELPAGAGALYLTRYLRERQAPLSREELKNLIAYHRAYGSKKLAAAVVTDWVRRFPEDKDALWALAQTQKADGQLEPAMHTLRQLLREAPDNPHYLLMAADVELAYYQSQRSYLNGVSNQQTLALLQRLLALEVEDKAGVYRKMAHVHALDREYATALRLIEQAAELGLQKTAHAVSSDVLWVEAAQMAIELEDFGKARHYLTKALTQNPQNATARELMRGLPTHDMSRVERVAKE